MPIRFGSEPGSLGGADKVYVGSDLVWPVSTLWTPEQLGADLLVWFDASDAATITLDGSSRVTAFANKGSLGGTATPLTANRPLYQAAGVNGLPLISNDNSPGDGLSVDFGSNLPTGDADSAMVGVGIQTANNAFARSLLLWGADVTDVSFRNIVGHSGLQYGHFSTANLIGGQAWLNAVQVSSYEHEAGWNYGTVSGTDLSPVSEGVLTTTADPFQLLLEDNLGLQEAMVLPRLLTADERLKLHGYLHHKWGVTANLPGAHPYKSAAPTV